MYNLILTTILLANNQVTIKESTIPDPYKTQAECEAMIAVAQEYVNRIARESGTVPGRVSCRLRSGV